MALYPLCEFANHSEEVFFYPVLTVAGVLPSLFGGPTMERSFLSFVVVLGGLDLPVGTGNTPGIL